MPDFATIHDAVSGEPGRIRYDLRRAASSSATPVVLIGGMTQTISSWGGQLRPLSETRDVMAYETRGQGSTELSLEDAGFARHVEDAVALLDAVGLAEPVDVCGFSFGGRVALALAAQRPERVRRLVLAGVGHGRSVLSRCIIDGWRAALSTGELEALARVSLSDIVGPEFLEANAQLVEPMIKAVVQRNRYDGIAALFRDTLPRHGDDDDAWSPAALAPRVRAPALVTGGAADRIASPDEVAALATALHAEHRIFAGSGHTVPIEAAEPWRRTVLAFLDAP